jgi:hypothetical protein
MERIAATPGVVSVLFLIAGIMWEGTGNRRILMNRVAKEVRPSEVTLER